MNPIHIRIVIALWIVLVMASAATGQSRAVGVAVDPVNAEFENARALAIEARQQYDEKSQELREQVAAGKVPPSHAARLQRLFNLDVLQAELKAALRYVGVLNLREMQNAAAREEIKNVMAETTGALKRAETQRGQLDRDVRERRGPALLIGLEYSELTGTSLPTLREDAQILQEFDRVLDDMDGSLKEGQEALRTLEQKRNEIDRNGPLLVALRIVANQRVELIRTKTILVRSGVADVGPLPDPPNFGRLPTLTPTAPGMAGPTNDLVDPEAVRKRISREDQR